MSDAPVTFYESWTSYDGGGIDLTPFDSAEDAMKHSDISAQEAGGDTYAASVQVYVTILRCENNLLSAVFRRDYSKHPDAKNEWEVVTP